MPTLGQLPDPSPEDAARLELAYDTVAACTNDISGDDTYTSAVQLPRGAKDTLLAFIIECHRDSRRNPHSIHPLMRAFLGGWMMSQVFPGHPLEIHTLPTSPEDQKEEELDA